MDALYTISMGEVIPFRRVEGSFRRFLLCLKPQKGRRGAVTERTGGFSSSIPRSDHSTRQEANETAGRLGRNRPRGYLPFLDVPTPAL